MALSHFRLVPGADSDLVKRWQTMNAIRFDTIMLKTRTVRAQATPEGIEVKLAPAEEGGFARAANLRPGAASRGPHTQRQEDRR